MQILATVMYLTASDTLPDSCTGSRIVLVLLILLSGDRQV